MADELASWDAWLAGQGRRAGFGQTAMWARILAAADGARHRVVRAGGGGALLTLRPPAQTGWRGRLRRARPVAECVGGPVLPDPSRLDEVLEAVVPTARSGGAGTLSVLPAPAAGWGDTDEARAAFAAAGFERYPWLTLLIDLTDDEDTLAARLNRNARKAVRRAERGGVVIERVTKRALLPHRFFGPYAMFSHVDPEVLIARGLATVDADDRQAYAWFVAVDAAGVVIGTLGTCRHGGVATEVMSSRAATSDLPAQDLLHWEALRHHRALGDEVFDLAGISPSPQTPAEAGIRRFKEKWGGVPVPMPRYERSL